MSRFAFEEFDEESLPLSDQEVIDALRDEREGAIDLFRKWYDENAPKDSPEKTSRDNILFGIKVGTIYYRANNIVDAEESFNDARDAAMLEEDDAFLEEVTKMINDITGNDE